MIFVMYFHSGKSLVVDAKSIFQYNKDNSINSDDIDFYTGASTETYIYKNGKWLHGHNQSIIDQIEEIQARNKSKKSNQEENIDEQ